MGMVSRIREPGARIDADSGIRGIAIGRAIGVVGGSRSDSRHDWFGAQRAAGDCYHRRMAKLLLNLRNVPDDEADDVRAFLDEHGIAYYETSPGFWNISLGGIWVREDGDFPEARRLMAEYQAQRGARVRAENEAARRDGTLGSVWTMLRDEPARVLLAVFGILFALALVGLPVLLIWR